MTFREKLQKERPDCVGHEWNGGCMACPKSYGYELYNESPCYPKDYVTDGEMCRACWDRTIPGTENPSTKPDLNALIERAATKKDISVTIFITGDTTHISVYPCPDPSEKKGNPVAEAYRLLVQADLRDENSLVCAVSNASDLLKEALEC